MTRWLRRTGMSWAAVAIATVTALPVQASVLPSVQSVQPVQQVSAAASGPRTEPSHTEVRTVDGTGVVFQYGEVMPSFDGWRTQQPTRDYRSLDGTWRFRLDPGGRGAERGWQRPAYDDSGWDSIGVPSSWDRWDTPSFGGYDGSDFGEGSAFYDGDAWYRTEVRIPGSWAARQVRLAFLAASYRADVWVNGVHVGRHEGGHTPFALPAGDALRPGRTNTIAVRVFRRPWFEDYVNPGAQITDDYEIPYKPVDYWPYAGLTRSAWLEAVPRVTVAKVLVDAVPGRFEARVVVENHGRRHFRGTAVVDPGARSGAGPVRAPVAVPPGGVAVARVVADIPDAPTWSPGDPQLLRAGASLYPGRSAAAARRSGSPVVDRLTTTYGVRSVEVADAKLLVNDEPAFLKGVNWHEETPAHGRSMTRAAYDELLGRVLDTRANMIRNSVYNRHPYVYDWADRHGVFVMDDIDTMWLNTAQERLQTEEYGLARAMAAAMAWNQHNNPSVILWGLQNESEIDSPDAQVYRAWIADMKRTVNRVDLADRPVTWASSTTWDPAFDLADVIGFNEYFGYFYGENSDLGPTLDAVHDSYPDKPILITENGSWSYLGHHGPATEEGTEEWQAANFRAHWEQVVARKDFMAGYTFWVLKDYKTRLGYNQSLNGISVMGLTSFDGRTERLVYRAFRNADNPR